MSLIGRVLIVVCLLWGGGLFLLVRNELTENNRRYSEATEEPLSDIAHILATTVANDSVDSLTLRTESLKSDLALASARPLNASIYDLQKTNLDLFVYITDEKGIVIYDSRAGRDLGKDYSQWNDVYRTLRGEYGSRSSKDDPLRPGERTFYVAAPIEVQGVLRGVLVVGKPGRNAQSFITAAQATIRRQALFTFLIAAFLTLIIAELLNRPLRKLTSYAREVRDGKNPTPPLFSIKELANLTHALHEMRVALQGKQYVERYVQTLTHELKSPLTGIKGALEVMKDATTEEERAQFSRNIEVETERIEKFAQSLLSLSSLEAQEMKRAESIYLTELLDQIMQREAIRIAHKELQIESHYDKKIPAIQGNSFWLTSALSNIVRNAIEFSPEKAKIIISLTAQKGAITLTVIDEGPGIPEWALTKIYDKFFSLPRPVSNKKSSGLGLTIAKEVFALHGATIHLENNLSTRGVCATVHFNS